MRSPITFKEWLCIVGILFIVGAGFLLLEQLPFIDNLLDPIRDYFEIQSKNIY